MAKIKSPSKRKASSEEPKEVTVKYDLFDLPTAFHKAGLAGLVMLIESLKARHELTEDEAKYTLSPSTLEIAYTEVLVRKLMDDLYDAKIVEVAAKSKWPGATLKREEVVEEQENGKAIKTKRFVYDVVQPCGTFLRSLYPDEDGLWLKLWRDMLWNIPRGRPTTREPFNQRANGQVCKEGSNSWSELLKVHKASAKSIFHTAEVASALLLGAQATNAENVPFEGRSEQNLLLHFWPLTVLLFVPQQINADGSTDFIGYTLAVPEVSNLEEFVHDYPRLLNEMSKDACGYRPRQAVVDLPAEGALAFLDHLAAIVGLQIETNDGQFGTLRFSISNVEYLHLVKQGNNVKTVASGSISPTNWLLAGYRQLVAPKDESIRYRNPLFRRGLLQALLENEQWHKPFGYMLATFDDELFMRKVRRKEETDKKSTPQFANEVARKFRHENKLLVDSLERSNSMPETERPPTPISVIINRVVRDYLFARTQDKTGIQLDKFKMEDKTDWTKVPGEFNEAKLKLAQSLFLEFRSRKEQAFITHFAATFFSVTQRLSENDRLELADLLTNCDRGDDLKTLTLLSLSANS